MCESDEVWEFRQLEEIHAGTGGGQAFLIMPRGVYAEGWVQILTAQSKIKVKHVRNCAPLIAFEAPQNKQGIII